MVELLFRPNVTEQGVTEQNFCGCAVGVNTRIADHNFKDYPTASFIDENGGFYPFWEKIDAGFAWDAWGIANVEVLPLTMVNLL
jgi:hypothetical protein